MKTSNESPQQARKTEKPVFQPAKRMVFTYPLRATEADIRQSIQYYVNVANLNPELMASKLRVSVDPATITQVGNSKVAEVTGSNIDWIIKGGVPNPPQPPPPPIIPDCITYDSIQVNPGIQGNSIKSKIDMSQAVHNTNTEVISHLTTKHE